MPLAWTAKLDEHFLRWLGWRAALDEVRWLDSAVRSVGVRWVAAALVEVGWIEGILYTLLDWYSCRSGSCDTEPITLQDL